MSSRKQILETLRARLQELAADCHALGDGLPAQKTGIVSSGSRDLDRRLRHGGFEQGTLVEWIGTPGSGATTFALTAARAACRERGMLVVLDEKREFYPPAAGALGIDLGRTMVVQPHNTRDRDWSLVQILRSQGAAAVVCWLDRIHERMLRRMQLAAEQGRALGLLVRPTAALAEPSWAKVRLLVEAKHSLGSERRWRITVVDSQAPRHEVIELEMDDETGKLRQTSRGNGTLAVPLAPPLVARAPLPGATSA